MTCEDYPAAQVENGKDGVDGNDGQNGVDGTSCTVTRGNGFATITCDDGTTATVNDGRDGGNGGGGGFILGLSGTVPSAINVNGQTGLRGADQACRIAFDNENSAHMCTEAEVQRALASQDFSGALKNSVNGVSTYTVGSTVLHGFPGANEISTVNHTCWNMLYGSGHIGRSTLLQLFFDTPVDGGQTGHYYNLLPGQACGNTRRPLLCCR
jgi:hypothetical protein